MKLLLVCLVGLLVSVHASSVSPPVISGQVRLSAGSPVAGAQVVLFDMADLSRGPIGQATTDEEGQFALPLTASSSLMLPQGFALGPNYPNPFNPSTIIPYQLATTSRVRLDVFNVLGQRVATLVDEQQAAGMYRARWDGTDAAGSAAAAGVYIYRLTVGGTHWTGKMVLVDGQAGVPLGGPSVEAVSRVEGSSPSYGLVVSGEGLMPYVDSDFGVAMEPVVIELAAPTRMKVAVPTLEGLLGDVDNNGRVDMDDGLLAAMQSVDPELSLPHHGLMTLGDVNCDGRVELGDAALLATYVVNPADASISSLRIGQPGGYSLNPVTEMVWGSILRNDKQDATVARLLDEVPVLISGVMPIDGQKRLYLGIDQTWWDEHGGAHIYAALKERFPVTPIYVEPSMGVVQPPATRPARPAGKPMSPAQEAEPDYIFLDAFEDGLDGWQTTQWEARSLDSEATVPKEGTGNIVAQAKGCSFCFMTLTEPVDLSEYETVTLSFYRWMDAGMGDNEFLGIDIGNNGSYRRLDNWDKQHADGQWHLETYTLTSDDISDAFTIRFFAITQNAFTTVAVDNVMITAGPGSVVVEPVESEDEPEEEPEEQPEEEDEDEPDSFDDFFDFFDTEDDAEDDTEDDTEDEEELTLAVTNPFAFPRSLRSGGSIFIGARVTNTGDDAVPSQTASVYRHTTETANPRVGGVREAAAATIGALAADTSRNVSVRVLAPSVAGAAQYYYYICVGSVCADTPVTITVQPSLDQPEPEESEDPTTRPELLVSDTAAQPSSLQSGYILTITATVTNSGTASATSKVVSIYRHTRATNNPRIGGIKEQNTAVTGSLAPNAAVTVTSTHQAPTVSATRRYYYYLCVDRDPTERNTNNNCSATPAEVVVRVKSDDPGPPYESCFDVPERSTPMGGDVSLAQPFGINSFTNCGTITLGGLETTTGEKGLIVSAHVVADVVAFGDTPADYTKTDVFIAHGEGLFPETTHLLGKVFRMPTFYTEGTKRILSADAAFVAYPSPATPGCSLTWASDSEEFCLDLDQEEYIERVAPLSIRGENGRVYTVVGSKKPSDGLAVRTSPAVTGVPLKGVVTGGEVLRGHSGYYIYSHIFIGDLPRSGDSGSPVYTVPNSVGNTHIVGILRAVTRIDGKWVAVFDSWDKIAQELDLKPIRP